MSDTSFIIDFMQQYYTEIQPMEFYRAIFPPGELATHEERNEQGKYTAVAVELLPKGDKRGNARRYMLTDELDYLPKLLEKKNFIIVSPISYAGRSRESINARYIYALAIDLDGVTEYKYIRDLFYQMENKILPTPTYTVASGSGLHLYYQFEIPIPCFRNITKQLHELKQALTRRIWNEFTTSLAEKPQLQSIFQGFRLVGGVTKQGNRTRAYKTGNVVTVEYLNTFVMEKDRVTSFAYKSELTLKQAKEKYPEWYEQRIVQKKKKGTWECKADLYNWWLRTLKAGATVGHRYNCVMCLAIYAKKSGISREQLETDAFNLVDELDGLTKEETNHFTREDVIQALEMFNDNYITYPIDSITQRTAIPIQKNKRNFRKQADHVKVMNAMKKVKKELGEHINEGRPTKQAIIEQWQQSHPTGTKADCIRETGADRKTVSKYWKPTGQQ